MKERAGVEVVAGAAAGGEDGQDVAVALRPRLPGEIQREVVGSGLQRLLASGSSDPPSPENPRDFAGLSTSVNVPAEPSVSVNALTPVGPPHTCRPVPKRASGSSRRSRSGSFTATPWRASRSAVASSA